MAEEYRGKHDLAVIISNEQIVAADEGHDVTRDVVALLKDVKVNYGDIPELMINSGTSGQTEAERKSSESAR